MGLKNTTENYGGLARFIHWVTAALIVVLIPLGLYMHELDTSPFKVSLFYIHKSLGFFVLALSAVRVVWTLSHPRPALLGALKSWESKLAHAVHGLFYLLLLVVPLSGWAMSSAHGYPVSVYGWFTLPDLVGESHDLAEMLEEVHELGAWGLVALLVLHIIGVIKHQGVYKDETLARMMPRRKIWFLGLPVLLALAFAPAVGKPLSGGPNLAVEDDHEHDEHEDHDDSYDPGDYEDDDDHDHDNHADAHAEDDHDDVVRWHVDTENSRLQFVAVIEGAEILGSFTDYDADIRFSPDDLEHSKVDVRINLQSVDTGNAERDDSLRSPAWFGVEKFPEARFRAEHFARVGGNDAGGDEYIARGELKIRDVKKDVVLPFTLDMTRDAAGNRVALMLGRLTLDRTVYGLGQNEWEDASMVAHEVRVSVQLRAIAEGGE